MYLVSPDILEKALDKNEEEGSNLLSRTSYPVLSTSTADTTRQICYEREITKSRLSPTTGTVDNISLVQKEMTDVLNDEDMDVEEKLHIYNQLMSRVLVNKAMYMFSPEPDVAPLPCEINEPVTIRGKKWTCQEGLPKRMLDAIEAVPKSYHIQIIELYKLLRANKNIRKDGRLLLGKKSIDDHHLTKLLALTAREKTQKGDRYPEFQKDQLQLYGLISKMNPNRKYIKNQALHKVDIDFQKELAAGRAVVRGGGGRDEGDEDQEGEGFLKLRGKKSW